MKKRQLKKGNFWLNLAALTIVSMSDAIRRLTVHMKHLRFV